MNNTIVEISDDEDIQPDKENTKKFYCNDLKKWIDIEETNEWAKVNLNSNIDFVFEKLRDKYFTANSVDSQFKVYLDTNNAIIDDSAFKIFERSKKILVSQSILTRPRIQQVSIILHILIHLFLNKASSGEIGIHKHDENFRSIMHYINNLLYTNITFSHTFMYQQDENDYSKHWWICSGVCQHYLPFNGIIRSPVIPNESMLFWNLHREKCSGSFFRIFEIQKTDSLDEVDKKYVRNTYYQDPKPNNNDHDKVHPKNLPIREKVDLTSDTSSPVVRNLCDIIDLDESQYNIQEVSNPKYFEAFKKLPWNTNSCPFCRAYIHGNLWCSHFDVCMGYQETVHHGIHPSIVSKMVKPQFY